MKKLTSKDNKSSLVNSILFLILGCILASNPNGLVKFITYLIGLIFLLMGISRNYLMVHYPSDILGGFLSGLIASVIAFYITKLIYVILDKYDNKVFKFIKEFDIVDCIRKKKHE